MIEIGQTQGSMGRGDEPEAVAEAVAPKPATAERAERVPDRFVPLMGELAGFRGCSLLDGGPDVLTIIREGCRPNAEQRP